MGYRLSKRSLSKLKTTKEPLQRLFMAAISDSPFDYGVSHGLRTTQEQQKLYAKGRTTEGKIVTYVDGVKRKSRHQYGDAVDVVCYVDGKITWNPIYYRKVAAHIKQVALNLRIDIEWGGDWKNFKDYPHYQLKR